MSLQKDFKDMPANHILRSQKLCHTNHVTIKLPSKTKAKYDGRLFFVKKRAKYKPATEGSGRNCKKEGEKSIVDKIVLQYEAESGNLPKSFLLFNQTNKLYQLCLPINSIPVAIHYRYNHKKVMSFTTLTVAAGNNYLAW